MDRELEEIYENEPSNNTQAESQQLATTDSSVQFTIEQGTHDTSSVVFDTTTTDTLQTTPITFEDSALSSDADPTAIFPVTAAGLYRGHGIGDQPEGIYVNEPSTSTKRGSHTMDHQEKQIHTSKSSIYTKRGCRFILVLYLILIIGSYVTAIILCWQEKASVYEDFKTANLKLKLSIKQLDAKFLQSKSSTYEEIKIKTLNLTQNIQEVEANLKIQNKSFTAGINELRLQLNQFKAQFQALECPGVTFHFPRENQMEDYVQYTSDVPKMNEFTICTWIKTNSYGWGDTFFSYAVPANANELWLYFKNASVIHLLSAGTSVALNYQHGFQKNKNIHICVWYSSVRGEIGLFLNGTEIYTKAISAVKNITGGGSLVLGQDQDGVGGNFQADQAFSGNLTNLILWKRALSKIEIFNIAKFCICPQDYSAAMLPFNTQIYGEAYYSPTKKCPVV